MKSEKTLQLSLAVALAIGSLCAAPVNAAHVTSLPGGVVLPMPAEDYFGPGPRPVAAGVTWTSTNASNQSGSVFGYTGGYGFDVNGAWDGTLGPMAGVNDSFDIYGVSDTMTFAFSTPVQGVGGFLNYVPGGSTSTTIAVYDALDTLIESYTLTFSTGGFTNSGEFHGFQEATANISYFKLTDNYIGLTDLTVLTSEQPPSAPEPISALLVGAGLLGIGALRHRKQA